MNQPPSIFIKIAAFLFLVGGLINLVISARSLIALSGPDAEGLVSTINIVTTLLVLVSAILNILIGWFLIKLKKWAYVLGLILVILALAMHVFTLSQLGTTAFYKLALSAVIFILLILGRKDFKKAYSA